MPTTPLPIAVAKDRAGLSVPELAAAIGINEAWCWDLLAFEGELTHNISLREFLNAASALHVSPLSLLTEAVTPAVERRSFEELAQRVSKFCAERGITADQFGELAGWDVQNFLNTPSSAFDDWCLDSLRDVCSTLSLHWPDFLPEKLVHSA